MIDLRTHVAALAAVFIALALGMLIGATRGSGALTRWRDAAVAHLEDQIANQQARQGGRAAALTAARARLISDLAFARAALPWVVQGRLTGRRITVVAGSPLGSRIVAIVRQAGADATLARLDGHQTAGGTTVVVVTRQQDLGPAEAWLAALRQARVRAVGAEPQTAAPVADALFARYGLSFVDDAEQPEGQAALVLLLAGARGHYGREPSAHAPLPGAP